MIREAIAFSAADIGDGIGIQSINIMIGKEILKYKVADFVFTIVCKDCETWGDLSWHFEPFVIETDETPSLALEIRKGRKDMSGLEPYFIDEPIDKEDITMRVYKNDVGLVFELQLPHTEAPNCWLTLNDECTEAVIELDESNEATPKWKNVSALTSATQLTYIMATSLSDILMGHASTVEYGGKAYLFIAKSGTGKSTHSKLWLKHIPGTILLNDDHPIVRITTDGEAMAYGSPWSGKTNCYKNLSYPIGGIIRIKRALVNRIYRQTPLQAYASASTSFSGFKWHRQYADARHSTLEKLVANVPCYVLECLPDEEAAMVCHNTVTKEL